MLDLIAPSQLAVFMAAGLALNLTPGPDMMLCLGQGLRGGPAAGVAASVGVATGALIHTVLAAAGLAALLATEPLLFEVIRWTGVAYLTWLALKMLRALGGSTLSVADPAQASPLAAWRDGMVVNLLNPKVALFILAFIPQFVDPAGSVAAPFIALGLVSVALNTAADVVVTHWAVKTRDGLARRPSLIVRLRQGSAAVMCGLGATLLLARRAN